QVRALNSTPLWNGTVSKTARFSGRFRRATSGLLTAGVFLIYFRALPPKPYEILVLALSCGRSLYGLFNTGVDIGLLLQWSLLPLPLPRPLLSVLLPWALLS